MKNYCKNKFKAKASVSTFAQDSSLNKVKKDKEKKQYIAKQNSTNPATRVNTIEVGEKK